MNMDVRLRLEELLDRETELARALALTLADERAALTGSEPGVVEEQAAEKIRLFNHIEALDAERRALCENPGAPHLAAPVVARWRALMQLLAGCRSANELNGHIIRVRQHQVRQLIDIVRGQPAPLTYDPHGKTSARALRALARA